MTLGTLAIFGPQVSCQNVPLFGVCDVVIKLITFKFCHFYFF